MVKRITITLDDDVFEDWKARKGSRSWFEFFEDLIKRSDETECISQDSVRSGIQNLCESLSKMAALLSSGREESLLRICAGKEDVRDLVRAFLIITNALEEKLDGINRWLATMAKVLILDLIQGNVDDAYQTIREMCSISNPSQ